jgi:hypothetical protein
MTGPTATGNRRREVSVQNPFPESTADGKLERTLVVTFKVNNSTTSTARDETLLN